MTPSLRIEYPGASYHIIVRGEKKERGGFLLLIAEQAG